MESIMRNRLGCPAVEIWQAFMAIACVVFALLPAGALAGEELIGEHAVITRHLDQQAIEAGEFTLDELVGAGQHLFDARFNILDGQGRPESTGTGAPRAPGQPAFIRTSGPDATSCAGCHFQPRSGGAGDFVANVFVLAQALDPVTDSVDGAFSNERNTLGMFGAGAIEMLAREMSEELIAIRESARAAAENSGQPESRPLMAKGVSFGEISVLPDGKVDPSGIEGVDWDLIVKPFHQKGAVVSLREFSNNATNHHHGIQSVERFGAGNDADNDGVSDELTVGDITAVTIFQAALPAPRTASPSGPAIAQAVKKGTALFTAIGCGRCHRPELVLEQREFIEPNPFNPAGNLQPGDVAYSYVFDLVKTSKSPFVHATGGGRVAVRAFTDLKRHNLNDVDLDHFDNEQVPQGKLNGFASPAGFTQAPPPRPTAEFLTRKLWDAGNSAPYGHRGDLTTLTEAIFFHGGEASAERDAFFGLTGQQQAELIEFLKSMIVTD